MQELRPPPLRARGDEWHASGFSPLSTAEAVRTLALFGADRAPPVEPAVLRDRAKDRAFALGTFFIQLKLFGLLACPECDDAHLGTGMNIAIRSSECDATAVDTSGHFGACKGDL